MSNGQEFVFARSEVPPQFASAPKSEQIEIIKTGTLCHFTVEAKLRSKMTNADQSEWIEIGREEGLQQKQRELDPKLREFETLSQQNIDLKSDKDSLQRKLYVRDKEECDKIKTIVSEKEKELEEKFATQKSKLADDFAEDLEEKSKQKAEQLSWEEKKKAQELETQNIRLQNEIDNLNKNIPLTSLLVTQMLEKDVIIQELKEQLKSLQEVKQTPNSQHLGAQGEEDVLSILKEALCDMKVKIKDIHSRGHEADVIVDVINSRNETINFKVDGKNSNKDGARIQTTECDKIKDDVDGRAECCFGILIAHRGKIDGGIKHLDIERSPKNKVIIYLCWVGMTREQKIESVTDVVKVLIEIVSLNQNNQEQQDKIKNELNYLKKKNTRNIKDVLNLANSLKKAWDDTLKLYNKMLKVSQSTEHVDSDSESDEEKPPSQRGRGRGKGRGRGS